MFGIKNNEKIKKESSLILRKAKFQAIFKFVLPLASKGTEGIKYNLNFLRIGRSLEKFFQKNFRDDSFTFGFAKVKTLSFLRLRGASDVAGIRNVITRRTSVRRGYLPEQGTHANKESLFASVTCFMRLPRRIQRMLLVMTIPALALLFTLVTISESRAEYCEPRISSRCWSGGSHHINSGLCYYYKCYSDETKSKIISNDIRLFLLEANDYQSSTAPDGTITIVNKNDTTEVYTIDTAPIHSNSSYAYDDNGKEYKTHDEYNDASGYSYNYSYAYDDNWKQYKTHDEWTYADGHGYNYSYAYDDNWNKYTTHNEWTNADGSGYSYDYGYDDSWHQTSQNYVSKDKDGNITETRDSEWTYDENGRRTDENYVRKDGNGNMLDYGSEQNEYNADGNQISRDYNAYYGNGQLMDSEQNTYVYDDDGNEIHNEYVNKEYYENGQISYDEYEEWDEVTGSKDFEKSYYENGQLSYEYESYDYPDGTWNSSQKDYYENGQLSQTNVWGTDENGIYTDNYVYYDENGNITSEENYTRNPDGTWTQDNMYYEYDDDGKLISKTNEICNNDGCSSVSYDANGDLLSVNGNEVTENCASADSNGVCTKCKDGFDDIDGYCNKIRWTPAEAAKVLRDDNTNEVTITFKK